MSNMKACQTAVLLLFVCLLCQTAHNAAAAAADRPHLLSLHNCKCYPWNSLKERKFVSLKSACNSTSHLVCCTSLADKFASRGEFCCFDHPPLTPPPFIKRCDPRLKEFVDLKTAINNYSKNHHNASFHHVSATIERSLLPNAIMVFFSLFFVFVYCFASLRRDVFRNRIYIERRVDCCRLGPQIQLPRSATPPQPPAYNSLPKDPPRYSSIFGTSPSPPSTPSFPTTSLPPPNNEIDANPITNSPPLIASHSLPTNQPLSLYTTPLQVLFLRRQSPKVSRSTRLAEVFKSILSSKPSRRGNCSEMVVQTSSPTMSHMLSEQPSHTNLYHHSVDNHHPSTSHHLSSQSFHLLPHTFPNQASSSTQASIPRTSNVTVVNVTVDAHDDTVGTATTNAATTAVNTTDTTTTITTTTTTTTTTNSTTNTTSSLTTLPINPVLTLKNGTFDENVSLDPSSESNISNLYKDPSSQSNFPQTFLTPNALSTPPIALSTPPIALSTAPIAQHIQKD